MAVRLPAGLIRSLLRFVLKPFLSAHRSPSRFREFGCGSRPTPTCPRRPLKCCGSTSKACRRGPCPCNGNRHPRFGLCRARGPCLDFALGGPEGRHAVDDPQRPHRPDVQTELVARMLHDVPRRPLARLPNPRWHSGRGGRGNGQDRRVSRRSAELNRRAPSRNHPTERSRPAHRNSRPTRLR